MKKAGSYLVAALLALLCVAGGILPASAATSTQSGQTSSGLSITPRKDYVIHAGESITDTLTIGNLSQDEALDITIRPIDFTFMDQSGTPKLFLAANAPQTTWSLKPFMTLPKTFNIAPGESKTVNYSIKIPANQGAGSYYSAIQYAATGPNGDNVDLSASGVTLVFVSVPGTVNENLTLKKLGAFQPDADTGGKYVFIATSTPQDIAYTLANSSNVAESPAGSIVLKNDFFNKKITIDNANPNSSLALIGQTRLFQACIQNVDEVVQLGSDKTVSTVCKTKPSLWPGRYSVWLDVFYGQNGNNSQEITGTASFWYLPWWFLLTVLGIIVVVALVVWWFVRKIRRAVNGQGYRSSRRKRR